MKACYTLRVYTEFSAAHTLAGYDGACQRMHGHNWKVETQITSDKLDDVGMAIDFHDMKSAARQIGDELDHRYLNELDAFKDINPTAENIAVYFYKQLSERLNTDSAKVSSVTIWENDRACVSYSESEN